jgi:hypothetical protein
LPGDLGPQLLELLRLLNKKPLVLAQLQPNVALDKLGVVALRLRRLRLRLLRLLLRVLLRVQLWMMRMRAVCNNLVRDLRVRNLELLRLLLRLLLGAMCLRHLVWLLRRRDRRGSLLRERVGLLRVMRMRDPHGHTRMVGGVSKGGRRDMARHGLVGPGAQPVKPKNGGV